MRTLAQQQPHAQTRRVLDPARPSRAALSEDHSIPQPQHASADQGSGPDFSRISLHARTALQAKATVSAPGDRYEAEADREAERVMRARDPAGSRPATQTGPFLGPPDAARSAERSLAPHDPAASSGSLLPTDVRAFMEPRFGADFAGVRVHTDLNAIQMNRRLNAQAFTYGSDIYFGLGRYPGKDATTAHELTHVLQQAGSSPGTRAVEHAGLPMVQRIVELRPPGRGEASAFDRRQDLIDRLNGLSTAIRYRLEAAPTAPRERITAEVLDEPALTHFDRQMRAFIDRAELLPLRLMAGAGRVANGAGGFDPLLFDSFNEAYVDLDDLLASDDAAFQLVLLHFLTERASTRNYARRIGTDMSASFDRAHRAGREAETEFLRDRIGDPTIRFNYEEPRPNGTLVIAWRSDEGYRVFHIIRRAAAEVRGGEVSVQTRDGRRLSVEDFIAERAAAAAP
ncbi:MAG: DUF4157 domain-containing protein [Gemmatimonadales bacterium]